MEMFIIVSIVAIVASAVSFLIANKLNKAKFEIHSAQAQAKAKLIEHESQALLKDAKYKAQKDYNIEFKKHRKAFEKKQRELDELIESELLRMKKDQQLTQNAKIEVLALQKGLETQKEL